MPALTTIALVGSAAIGAGTSAVQNRQGRKAARSNRRIKDIEQKKSDVARTRENSQALAQQQSALASQQAQGAAAGIGSSSVLSGAQASVQSTTASNVGFADQINRLVQQQNAAAQSAANSQTTANNIGALGGVVSSALGSASAFAKKGPVFANNQTVTDFKSHGGR